MDSERCRLLGDPQASVRRTTQHWLACQRADTRAYSKGYSNAFQDRRAPGSSSDNMRDPLYTSIRRAAAAVAGGISGGDDYSVRARRRSASEQAELLRANLLLICREALDGPGSRVLPTTALQTAAAVASADPTAQQLVARLFYNRGDWHRLSWFCKDDGPGSALLDQAVQVLAQAGLARLVSEARGSEAISAEVRPAEQLQSPLNAFNHAIFSVDASRGAPCRSSLR